MGATSDKIITEYSPLTHNDQIMFHELQELSGDPWTIHMNRCTSPNLPLKDLCCAVRNEGKIYELKCPAGKSSDAWLKAHHL